MSASAVDPAALWEARVQWLAQQQWTHAVTLSYNDWPISRARMRANLRDLHGYVDRRLLGTRFHKLPPARRSRFVAFVEAEGHHPHLHCGWFVPTGRRVMELARLFRHENVWARFAPAGTFELRIIEQGRGWWSYATKHVTAEDDWFFSEDFLPPRVLV